MLNEAHGEVPNLAASALVIKSIKVKNGHEAIRGEPY
jgi:hypothetical protein